MKSLFAFICVLVMAVSGLCADKTAKPKLKVTADGYPAGHGTPEGAACDLARAFIKKDAVLFTNTCVRAYGGGKSHDKYVTFLQDTVKSIKEEAAKNVPSPGGPKSIGKVFAARHLKLNGPASWGYAAFDFQDVMFVDVGVLLQNGEQYLNRTMVIEDKDGKWYVHPAPDVDPLLSAGLNDETDSVQDFSEVYDVQK